MKRKLESMFISFLTKMKVHHLIIVFFFTWEYFAKLSVWCIQADQSALLLCSLILPEPFSSKAKLLSKKKPSIGVLTLYTDSENEAHY